MIYFGGKNGNGTYQNIINKIPPHESYIELFLGSGAILNYKKPAKDNIGVEINVDVISNFKYKKGTMLSNLCAFEFIKKYPTLFTKNTFVYVDPPYPLQARRNKKEVYKYEFTMEQHAKLLKIIKSMQCMIAISTYKNDLYERELKDWKLYTFESQTRKGKALEYLYMNYPEPTALHDYNYLGNNFNERQDIRRKIQRKVSQLKNLPVLERKAILEAISQLT